MENIQRNIFLSVWSLFFFSPFKVEGKELELFQSYSRHYHIATGNVYEQDLYGKTSLKINTQTVYIFKQNMELKKSGPV
jgi:hypothetical protein